MGLITCRECKAEISDSASSCPKCGAKKPTSIGKTVAIVIGVGVILFLAAVVFSPDSREQKAFNQSIENGQNAVDRANSLQKR